MYVLSKVKRNHPFQGSDFILYEGWESVKRRSLLFSRKDL